MSRDIEGFMDRLKHELDCGERLQESVNRAFRLSAYSPEDVHGAVCGHVAEFKPDLQLNGTWKPVEVCERVHSGGCVYFEGYDLTIGRLVPTGTARGSQWELYSPRFNSLVKVRYSVRRV